MEYRRLGKSGLQVSALSLGATLEVVPEPTAAEPAAIDGITAPPNA